jgi:hypothetical protein
MTILSAKSIPRWLEVAGQVLAVTTVLLPVLGSVVRWVSFAVTPGISTALELAPATSLPDLVGAALTGLAPSFAATAWYLAVFGVGLTVWRRARRAWGTPEPKSVTEVQEAQGVQGVQENETAGEVDPLAPYLARIGPLPDEPDRPKAPAKEVWRHPGLWFGEVQGARTGWDKPTTAKVEESNDRPRGRLVLTRQLIVVGFFYLIAAALLGWVVLAFATSPVDQGPASALWFVVFALMTGATLSLGWPTRSLILFAIAWLILVSLMTGLIYRGEAASEYDMNADLTSAPDGWYARIAERDGFLFLLPCPRGSSAVVAVRPDAIRSIRPSMEPPARRPVPSLWDLVSGRGVEGLGLDPACP